MCVVAFWFTDVVAGNLANALEDAMGSLEAAGPSVAMGDDDYDFESALN